MKKSLFAVLAVMAIAGSGMFVSNVAAQEAEGQNPMSSMVQKISEKFGLNEDEVQAVFDEAREEHKAEKTQEQAERLDQLVADGEITEAQKQLIVAKHAELQASRESNRDSMKDASQEERKASMESEREALESWAEQNGIDMKYLMSGGRGEHRGGPGGQGMGGMKPPAENAE